MAKSFVVGEHVREGKGKNGGFHAKYRYCTRHRYRAARVRTRGSPRSARFLSFSCLLLAVSFPSTSAAEVDHPLSIGYNTERQIL